MDSRERIFTALSLREPDRVPIHDGPWPSTETRWHEEGLPEGVTADEYFGFEILNVAWDFTPRFPHEVLQETDEYIVERASTGIIQKNFRDYSTTPEMMEPVIKTKEDWPAIKERLVPDEDRVDWEATRGQVDKARREGKFITLMGLFGFNNLQFYLATDNLLLMMALDPEWVRDMVMTWAELNAAMFRMFIEKGVEFDALWDFNDLGYRNGLFFSPETYRITHWDATEMLYSLAHEHGKPVILHSCGDVREMIPYLLELGLDCLQPLECKAGMDVRELKREYGDRLAFMGGIDVRVMAEGDPAALEEEIASKLEVAKQGGGYIYHSDHSVPKNVSFDSYCRVIELVKKHGQY